MLVVLVEQHLGLAGDHPRQSPAAGHRVLDARVHPHSAERRVLVRGITGQQDTADPDSEWYVKEEKQRYAVMDRNDVRHLAGQ